MRMRLLGGLCVALACGAWAGAETLDEAVARLAKAAAETRDVTVKLTLQGAQYEMQQGSDKVVKTRTMSGTGELQVLRDGGKCLMRLAVKITEERQGKDTAAAPEKRERNVLAVNDGQFLWKEQPRPGRDPAPVVKEQAPAEGGIGANRGSGAFLEAPFTTTGIKGLLDKMGGGAEIKVAGKGTIAGRPTTTIEISAKGERVQMGLRPAKIVVQFDDATGAAVGGQDVTAAGDVLMSFAATEVKANAGLDRKLFTYTPPEGAKVVDETKPPEKSEVPKPPEPEKKAP